VTALLDNLYPQQKLLSTDLSAAILTADVFYQCSMNAWAMLQNYGSPFCRRGVDLVIRPAAIYICK
jgi:hypothetical protein